MFCDPRARRASALGSRVRRPSRLPPTPVPPAAGPVRPPSASSAGRPGPSRAAGGPSRLGGPSGGGLGTARAGPRAVHRGPPPPPLRRAARRAGRPSCVGGRGGRRRARGRPPEGPHHSPSPGRRALGPFPARRASAKLASAARLRPPTGPAKDSRQSVGHWRRPRVPGRPSPAPAPRLNLRGWSGGPTTLTPKAGSLLGFGLSLPPLRPQPS